MGNLNIIIYDIFPFLIIFFYVVYIDVIKQIFNKYLAKYFKVDDENLKKLEIDLRLLKFANNIEHLQDLKYRNEELKIIFIGTIIYLIILSVIVFIIAPHYSYNLIEYVKLNSESILFCTIKSIILITNLIVLYAGQLIEYYHYEINPLTSKNGIRFFMENIYAPIIEEFMFRFIAFNILKINGHSSVMSALINSLMFGIAHLRHIFDRNFNINRTLFQIIYTFIFGVYSSYAYIYSNNLICPIILHIICNCLHIPPFYYINDEKYPRKLKILTSIIYILGILGFIILTYIFH
jgi:membrane protease YdiL (CAAX protease family)